MNTLDLLITKFNEFKEELNKDASPLHNTVKGFISGLKSLPKGTPERGKFITAHMNHGPFISALDAHQDGANIKAQLNNHLNSRANAGFKPGQTQVIAKSDEALECSLDKAYGGFKDKNMLMDASADAHRAFINKPTVATPHKSTLPSPEENAARAAMYDSYSPSKFGKTVNNSYSPSPNGAMAMSRDEKLTLNKGGQWSLENHMAQKAKLQAAMPKGGGVGLQERPLPQGGVAKGESCSKCHASPCECQTTGINVDKSENKVPKLTATHSPKNSKSGSHEAYDVSDHTGNRVGTVYVHHNGDVGATSPEHLGGSLDEHIQNAGVAAHKKRFPDFQIG